MEALTQDIWVETSFAGCNVGFVTTSAGIVMIDTPMRPSDAIKWREEIDKRGQVRFLINTEHHPDHVWGNFFFPGTVIAHQGTRAGMERSMGSIEDIKERIKNTDPAGYHLIENYQARMPDITFSDRLNLHLGRYTFELCHMPGHVPNSTMVLIPEAGVLFSSDNVVNNHYPHMHECLALKWLEALDKIRQLDVERIVPGHGDICGKEAVSSLSSYLTSLILKIEDCIKRTLTPEQVLAEIGFPPPFPIEPAMEPRIRAVHEQGIRRIYDQLKKARAKQPLPAGQDRSAFSR